MFSGQATTNDGMLLREGGSAERLRNAAQRQLQPPTPPDPTVAVPPVDEALAPAAPPDEPELALEPPDPTDVVAPASTHTLGEPSLWHVKPASTVQVEEQPSPLSTSPSSQPSPDCVMPLPHTGGAEHCSTTEAVMSQ